MNIQHYKLDEIDPELRKIAEDRKLTGPCFIGQGLTERVGSDCYGYYITSEVKTETVCNGKVVKCKVVYGIARANQVMHGSWTEGDMDCSLDWNDYNVCYWITKYGKSWYFCDVNGNRFKGGKCKFGWNGAYGYQDPSF